MMDNITDLESFRQMRDKFEERLKNNHTLVESKRQTQISPSGKYYFILDCLAHPENEKKDSTVAHLYRADGSLITTIYRNHPKFIFSWCEAHPSGHAYLICGFDIQGQTIVELDTGTRKDFMPPEAVLGKARCWANYIPSIKGTYLLLESCYIGGSIMTSIIDFSKPMTGFWDHIGVLDIDDEPINDPTINTCIRKWISDDEIEITYIIDVRKSDGKRISMLKESDLLKLGPNDIEQKEIIGRWHA